MSKSINSDLIRGNINTIILKALYEGDRYGYDIIKEIEEKSHGQYILKQPTLYSCLKRLESQGFINAYWGEQSNGGRRKYYSLTDLGREVFVRNQDEYEYSRTIIDQLISERDYDLDSVERPTDEDLHYYGSTVPDADGEYEETEEADSAADENKHAETEESSAETIEEPAENIEEAPETADYAETAESTETVNETADTDRSEETEIVYESDGNAAAKEVAETESADKTEESADEQLPKTENIEDEEFFVLETDMPEADKTESKSESECEEKPEDTLFTSDETADETEPQQETSENIIEPAPETAYTDGAYTDYNSYDGDRAANDSIAEESPASDTANETPTENEQVSPASAENDSVYRSEDDYSLFPDDEDESDYNIFAPDNAPEIEPNDEDYAADEIGEAGSGSYEAFNAIYDIDEPAAETPDEATNGAQVVPAEEVAPAPAQPATEATRPITETPQPAPDEPVQSVLETQQPIPETVQPAAETAQVIDDGPAPGSIIDELLGEEDKTSYTDNMLTEKARTPDAGYGFGSSSSSAPDYFSAASYMTDEPDRYGFAVEENESVSPTGPAGTPAAPAAPPADFDTYAGELDEDDTTAGGSAYSDFLSYDSPPPRPAQPYYGSSETAATAGGSSHNRNDGSYRRVLRGLVDDIEPDERPTVRQAAPEQQEIPSEEPPMSVREQIQVRNFGRLSQSMRDMGENVKIRTPDSAAAREYNKQYYYYSNSLRLWQYAALFLVMLLESFLTYVIIKNTAGVRQNYDIPIYVCSMLLCVALPVGAAIAYFINPRKRKRMDYNLKTSLIFRIIIMCQLILIVYAINIYLGMPIGGSRDYLLSMLLPCVLSTNVPISALIFNGLYRSKHFSVK